MRKSALYLAISIFSGAMSVTSFSAKAEDGWLSLTRTQIQQYFEVGHLEKIAPVSGQQTAADVAPLVAAGDTIWVGVSEKANLRLAMAGRGERVHSVRIYVPIVNDTKDQSAAMLRDLKAFYSAAFPNWSDASRWPEKSLDSSWSATASMMDHKPYDKTAIITSKAIEGVTLSTFGVPPDIALFGATARTSCVPHWGVDHQRDNPMQRLVCG